MDKAFRAAIVGMGGISAMHVSGLEALGVAITAVCDKHADRAQAAAEKTGTRAFTDYRDMLAAGGFDAVHICLPHFLHAPVAIDALEAGFHVLCEKPIATTVADGEKMLAAAEKNNRTLSVVFQNRFSPGAQLIKEALDAGELGAVRGGWLRVNWFRGMDYYTSSDWRGKWATEGGGVLINQSIHTFDLMNYFLGAPKGVQASIANRAHPGIEVEDMAEGVITYTHQGTDICVSFFVNTYHPYDAPVQLEIVAEKGRAAITGEEAAIHFNDGTVRTAAPDAADLEKFNVKHYWGVSHVRQIADFYESIEKNRPPSGSAASALITQRLICGIYAAVTQPSRLHTAL